MNILVYLTWTNCVKAGIDTRKTPNTPKTLNYAEYAVQPGRPTFIVIFPHGNVYSSILGYLLTPFCISHQ